MKNICPSSDSQMSSDQYHEIQKLICEKQIKSLVDIRQRFRQVGTKYSYKTKYHSFYICLVY